jgi:hypothetical protein
LELKAQNHVNLQNQIWPNPKTETLKKVGQNQLGGNEPKDIGQKAPHSFANPKSNFGLKFICLFVFDAKRFTFL